MAVVSPASPAGLYLILKVLSGPDAGRLVELTSGQIVYVGRDPSLERTKRSDTPLFEPNTKQLDRIEEFLEGRTPGFNDPERTQPGYRPRLEKLRRIADVRLVDGTVSRVHAAFYVEEGRAGVVDLASTNGTTVNGRKVSASFIEPGDQVVLGNIRLEVVGLG